MGICYFPAGVQSPFFVQRSVLEHDLCAFVGTFGPLPRQDPKAINRPCKVEIPAISVGTGNNIGEYVPSGLTFRGGDKCLEIYLP